MIKKINFKKIFFTLFIFFLFFPVFTTFAQTSAPPILDQIVFLPNSTFGQPGSLSNLFNQIFYVGLILAVVLAVVMIIRGGVEYMTIDSISGKENGKGRVKAALGGLTLAFAAILILRTINPGITSFTLSFQTITAVDPVQIAILNAVNSYPGMTSAQFAELMASGKIPTNISPEAQKILAEALNSIGVLKTGDIEGTTGGKYACAAAVNRMVELATGQPVGGGLSTAAMYDSLQNNSRFMLIPGGVGGAQPGDIIISPTEGDNTGHVGIVATAGGGAIISNSSGGTPPGVQQNYTGNSWNSRYGGKGLQTYIYRPLK